MHRVETLKREALVFECTAQVLTYSFLTDDKTPHVTPAVSNKYGYFRTRRIGSCPKKPTIVVVDAGKGGKWVAYLAENCHREHPVFSGWTKDQVTHSWLKQNGTILIGNKTGKVLEDIVKRCYPRLCVRNITWMAYEDVLCMIGTVNDPTSLLGKIPRMACERIPSPTLHQQLEQVLRLSSLVQNPMAHAKECYENSLCNALQDLYRFPGTKDLVQLEDVRKRHKKLHEDASHLVSVTKRHVKTVTNRARVDTYCKGLMALKLKIASV